MYSSVDLIGSTATYKCLQVNFPPSNVFFRLQMFFSNFWSYVALGQPLLYSGFHNEQRIPCEELHTRGLAGRRATLPRFHLHPLPSSRGEKTVHLKRVEESLSIISRTHTLPSWSGRNRVWFRIEVVDMRGNSFFARPSDSLVALNHCQSPTVFRTE